MLLGRSPLRISFVGGGTDLEEYHKKYDGYSISATINKFAFVAAKLRTDNLFQAFSPDYHTYFSSKKLQNIQPEFGHAIAITCLQEMKFSNGIDLFYSADVAPGSGLGASSSLASNIVNIILKFQKKKWNKHKMAMEVFRIGHDVLKWGIGKQDEFAAVFGGFNLYKFSKNNVTVTPIRLNKSTLKEFENNSMLFFLGDRKPSSEILKIQQKNIERLNNRTISALHKVSNLTLDMRDAFRNNDLERFESILHEGWEQKKQFARGVSNKKIDSICKIVESNGAKSMKVTGSGGGGHLFVYTDSKKHQKITRALKKIGIPRVEFKYKDTNTMVQDMKDLE